jgi:hypothetical protein
MKNAFIVAASILSVSTAYAADPICTATLSFYNQKQPVALKLYPKDDALVASIEDFDFTVFSDDSSLIFIQKLDRHPQHTRTPNSPNILAEQEWTIPATPVHGAFISRSATFCSTNNQTSIIADGSVCQGTEANPATVEIATVGCWY